MAKYFMDIIKTTKVSVLVNAKNYEEACDKCIEACENDEINFEEYNSETEYEATVNEDSCKKNNTFDEKNFSVDGCQVIE